MKKKKTEWRSIHAEPEGEAWGGIVSHALASRAPGWYIHVTKLD